MTARASKEYAIDSPDVHEFHGPAYPPQGQWTYEDYLRLPDDGRRYEILRGVLYVAAAPNPIHQIALRNLVRRLSVFLENHPIGEFFLSPTDLILPEGLTAPVQPDLFYVRGEQWKGTITSRYMEGVPDLVVEVLSPSTRRYDRNTKLGVYAQAGVGEYWLADPLARTFEVLVLRDGAYVSFAQLSHGDHLRSEAIPGFEPSLEAIFKV
ncbi:MAG TPA: Uma2 family endonuclease [Thermoanaerobaculia bacterium]|nr:Uma2 family endonuclease [Thermoanaerobaculia bacterium]